MENTRYLIIAIYGFIALLLGNARISLCMKVSFQSVIQECRHLKTGPHQSNSFLSDHGYQCCMCPIGTYMREICRPDEPNSTVCEPCTHNSTRKTYIDFQPHTERKCYPDTTTCLSSMNFVEGTRSSKSRCDCQGGYKKMKILCIPLPKLSQSAETTIFQEISQTPQVTSSDPTDSVEEVKLSTTASATTEIKMTSAQASDAINYNATKKLASTASVPENSMQTTSENSTQKKSYGGIYFEIRLFLGAIFVVGLLIFFKLRTSVCHSCVTCLKACVKRDNMRQCLPLFQRNSRESPSHCDKEIGGDTDADALSSTQRLVDHQQMYVSKCESEKEIKCSTAPECFCLLENNRYDIITRSKTTTAPCINLAGPTESEKLSEVLRIMAKKINERDLPEVGRSLLGRREFEEIFYNQAITYKTEKAHIIFGRAMELNTDFNMKNVLKAVKGLAYLEEIVYNIECGISQLRTDGNVD